MTHGQITTRDKDAMLGVRDAQLRYMSDRRPVSNESAAVLAFDTSPPMGNPRTDWS